jgi:hypothetical protein
MSGRAKTIRAMLILLAAGVVLTFVVPVHLYPANYPADDAFFYMQVASHIVAGHGSTFHTITPTNGYHPLWMLVCVVSTAFAGGSRSGALHVALAVQQCMAAATVLLFFRIAHRLKFTYAWAALPLLLLYFSTRLYLSEAYLNALLVLTAVWFSLPPPAGRRAPWRCALIGVCGGVAMLARLDNVFVVAMLFSLVLLDEARWDVRALFSASTLARAFTIGLPCLLVLAPYLIHNQVQFGHCVPVSGAIKSTMPQVVFNRHAISRLGQAGLVAATLGLIFCLRRDTSRPRRLVLGALSAGVWLQAMQIVFMTRHHTGWPWYYVSGVLVMGWVGLWVLERMAVAPASLLRYPAAWLQKGTRLCLLALALGLAVNGYAWVRYRSSAPLIRQSFERERLTGPHDTRWQIAAGQWLATALPANSGIMVYDWPGMIAYASGQRILPPDGLINDFAYNDDILRMGIGPYLQSKGVGYWLGPADPSATPDQYWYHVRAREGGQSVEVFSPLYRTSAGTFKLEAVHQVARLRDAIPHQDMPDLVLWRIGSPNTDG